MSKILFLCAKGQETFVKPVAEHFKTLPDYQVKECYSGQPPQLVQALDWANIVWQEWADPLCALITRHPHNLLNNKKLIVRLHSYEVLQIAGGFIKDIDWNKCDALICVADHVRIEAVTQIRTLTQLVKDFETYVIPNGVDLEKFKLTEDNEEGIQHWINGVPYKGKLPGKNLAYIGFISHKKGPMLMLHAFNELVQSDKEYKLHVAGEFQELRFSKYWEHMIKEMNLEKNIEFHGNVTNMPEFLKEMHYVVCSSPWESQNMSVMEGMATGCMPLVHNFPGARDIYSKKYLWTTIPEFVDKIKTMPWEPEEYRQVIQDRYNVKDRMKDLEEVVKSLETPSYGESFIVKG